MIVSMEHSCFAENNVIERHEYKCLPFNTKVVCPENCEVVVVADGVARRLKKLDDNLLNPKKGMFLSKKTDTNRYVVFFVDKAHHDATWGGHVYYDDKKVDGIQERIFIRAAFTFNIIRGDRTIALLSETKKRYEKRYLVDKIRVKIDNVIKKHVCEKLNDKGFVVAQEYLPEIAESAMRKLNEEIMSLYGIELVSLNLTLEEDVAHSEQRNEMQWSAQINNKGEKNV